MEFENSLKTVLVDELFVDIPRNDIGLDDGLRDKLGLDSLGFSELRAQCETLFGVKISDNDFVPENFTSLRTLISLLERLKAANPEGVSAQ